MYRYYVLFTLPISFLNYAMYSDTNAQEKFIDRADKGDICYVLDMLDRDKSFLCARDCIGRTALHRALLRGNKDIALMLIQATYEHYTELAQQLSSAYPLNMQDFEGNTPLHIAFDKQYTDLIQELYTAKADITLANNNNITIAELLVQQHEKQTMHAPDNNTLAVSTEDILRYRRVKQPITLLEKNHKELIQLYTSLLEQASHAPSRKLLYKAIQHNFVSIVQMLIDAGVPILQEDIEHARIHHAHDTIQLLLKNTHYI